MTRPVIGLTMGDAAGIGPEICLRAMQSEEVLAACRPVLFGSVAVLERVGERLGLAVPDRIVAADDRSVEFVRPTVIDCGPIDVDAVRPGRVSAECGRTAAAYIRTAVEYATAGRIAGLATAPIHKEALHEGGVPYPGHTEMLADLTHAERYCMTMASDEMIVSLVTTHIGLADVPSSLSTGRIVDVIELTTDALKRLGKELPLIAVCGLNPHAGESGLFGGEEQSIIVPAVAEARRRGIRIDGVLPPDTAFVPGKRNAVDAYVAMYHDQGLIPFKMLSFETGVNITLGLPIVRTSVDHGTAFDIAWRGCASAQSLVSAVRWCVRLSVA